MDNTNGVKVQNEEQERFFEEVDGHEKQDEDVIQKTIGVLGRWQIFVFFILCVIKIPVAWQQLSIVFIAPPVNFICLENNTEQCATNCSEHVFDRSLFSETIVTEWDLICDRNYLKDLAQTLTMVGVLSGNMIFGYLSDKFGRRSTLIGAVILQIITSLGTALSKWFILFLVLKFLAALATGGTMLMSFVIVMEIVGAKWRTTLGILYQMPFSFGHATLPLFAYFIRNWRHFQIAISVPPILLLSYFWILPESPRWLLAMGRKKQAIRILEKAAKWNNLPVDNITKDVNNYSDKKQTTNDEKKESGGFVDLVRTPIMRTYTLCLGFNWLTSGLCFFGAAQYIGQLGGNIFINVALSAVIQIPANLFNIYSLQKWGRKRCLIYGNLTSAISSLLIALVPEEQLWLKTILSSTGILGLSITFTTIYIYSGELFPTMIRNVGVGTSSMFARIGSMVAPFVAGLVVIKAWLPAVIFGVLPLIAAALTLLLPETLGCKLPDTIEEAEQIGRGQKSKEEEKGGAI